MCRVPYRKFIEYQLVYFPFQCPGKSYSPIEFSKILIRRTPVIKETTVGEGSSID